MDEDDDRPKKVIAHEVGMVLDPLSIDELEGRVVLLEEEIGRLRQAIEDKSATRSAADEVFKI